MHVSVNGLVQSRLSGQLKQLIVLSSTVSNRVELSVLADNRGKNGPVDQTLRTKDRIVVKSNRLVSFSAQVLLLEQIKDAFIICCLCAHSRLSLKVCLICFPRHLIRGALLQYNHLRACRSLVELREL